ncbi:MAG: leucine-rich repeat domain-containing protein [Clostridia bacterium]|nr:leucine-rich repeat domain-containing protein [Clostridia bacterium]
MTGDDIVNIYDYIGTSDIVTVPASINGHYVDVLDGAFQNCNKLTDVTFSPDCRITKLGNYTFSNCNNLKNIVLPDSLTEIGSSAFNSCNSLTYIAIPKNVKYIGNQVFSYCSNLPYIYLPYGLEKIGFRAFEDCRRLKYIFIPDSVSDINFGLFSNTLYVNIFCQAQSKPDGWDDNWNSNRPNLTWGCSDYGITEDGFVWIEKDGDVRILDNIGSSSNLIIPAKVNGKYFTSIADKAFYDRNDVNSLEFDADSKIHTIGEQAFSYCENLTTVTLPNSLVIIKNSAFNRCRFSQIIIPLSVTEIQEYAFSNNSSLKYIYCEASQKPDNWASNWYSGYNATVRWGYTGN